MRFDVVLPWVPLVGLLLLGQADAQDDPDATETAAMVEGVSASDSADGDGSETPTSGETVRQLRTAEERVQELKERVFRSKATLQLLRELVIEGATMGSRVAIWHVNRLGGGYTVESIQYFLDGKNIYSKVDPGGSLNEFREVKVREQTVAPGTHNLLVRLVLRGNGFGIFSYLKTYKFRLQSSYTFEVEDGRLSTIRVVSNSRGGLRRSYVERPNVEYEERAEQLRGE